MQTDPHLLEEDHDPELKVTEHLLNPRIAFELSDFTTIIKGKEKNFKSWSETAHVESISSSGAGFRLARRCEVGRLVSLIMAMPAHLRRYDQDKRLYRIWGLIQYCYEAGDEAADFHVGVALVGKNSPRSYGKNPAQCYRVSGMDKNGLWRIEELDTAFVQRTYMRYWNSIETTLYQLDSEQRPIAREKTVTENISESGASVFSGLRVSVGDRIKFKSSSPAFSSLSVVRHRRIGSDERTRVHLEFVENAFPILEIEAPIEEEGEH